jgi:hypothetical protein
MENNVATYRKLSKKELSDAMADLSKIPMPEKRPYTILTGRKGMRQFDKNIKQAANMLLLESLERRGLVTKAEFRSIEDMINSDDYRDVTMAEAILEIKNKEYEPNI